MDVHITSKGQVTIPQAIRERYGFMPATEIEFVERDGWVGLQTVGARKAHPIDDVIRQMTGAGTGILSTDEIMELTREYSLDA